MATESSLFSRISNAGDGVCAIADFAANSNRRTTGATVRQNEDCPGHVASMFALPFARTTIFSNKPIRQRFAEDLFIGTRFSQLLLDARRQRFHPRNVGSDGPQLLVRIPFAVREHAREADAVFGDPENLRFGVLRPRGGKV